MNDVWWCRVFCRYGDYDHVSWCPCQWWLSAEQNSDTEYWGQSHMGLNQSFHDYCDQKHNKPRPRSLKMISFHSFWSDFVHICMIYTNIREVFLLIASIFHSQNYYWQKKALNCWLITQPQGSRSTLFMHGMNAEECVAVNMHVQALLYARVHV